MALHPRRPGEPWLGGGTGGVSGPGGPRGRARAGAEVARARRDPDRRHGRRPERRARRDLLDAGATIGRRRHRESFRDPLAGARIAAELAQILANSGMIGAWRPDARAQCRKKPCKWPEPSTALQALDLKLRSS